MKRKLLILSVLAICIATLAAGTLAYFTSEGKAHNVITTGGVEIAVAEEADTLLFDHEGSFRQYFTNGAILEFDKKTGNAIIHYNCKKLVSVDDVMVREMNQIQTLASGLSPGRFSKEVCVLCLKECYKNRVKVGG